MKILVILGSDRKGNTYKIVEAIKNNVKKIDSRIEFEFLHLNDLNIDFCKGCYLCFDKGEEFCPNKDDLKILYDKIDSSDGLIIASPIYALSLSANLKNVFDRFAYVIHRPRFFNKSSLCVVTTFASPNMKNTLELIKANLWLWGFNVTGKIGITGGTDKSFKEDDFPDKKTLKKIRKLSISFFKDLKMKKFQKPSFMGMMKFELVRNLMKNEKTADSEYFEKKGWSNPKVKYYYDVRINVFKRIVVKIIVFLAKKFMKIK